MIRKLLMLATIGLAVVAWSGLFDGAQAGAGYNCYKAPNGRVSCN